MPAIHQFVAGFTNGDAISNEALAIQRIFRSWGYASEIFSEPKRILPELRKRALDASHYAATPEPTDAVLLHLSIGSTVNDAFATLPCRKAILYHNITPPRYFDLINKKAAYDLEWGRKQLAALAQTAEINLADSRFNAMELTDLGYRDVRVLPLVLETAPLESRPDAKVLRRFRDGKINVLFVGRCAPNKKLEDLIQAFSMFHRFVEPNSRLIHVGSFAGTERYYYLLLTQAQALGASAVHFAGSVPQAQLNAYYRVADLFLCMSEHEGFCIPLIESLYHDVPVMAYAAAAVPETLDGAGVLFHEKRFDLIAEMMGRVVRDQGLRAAILDQQRARLQRYTARDLGSELEEHLAPLLGRPARPASAR